MIITIIAFLGVIAVLILVHELGHLITAKASGVRVDEFGLGFPPRLLSIRRGGTRYSLNAIPLGGFVKMAGEEDPKVPRSLASKGTGTRLLVLSAGSLMNALLPLLLFSIAFMVPHNLVTGQVVVEEVALNSPAARAGIEAGDVIVSINDKPVHNIGDLHRYIHLNLGKEVTLLIKHSDSTTEEMRLTPRWKPPEGQNPVGLTIVRWVAVREIASDSPADRAGIRPGDLLLSIDGEEVHNADDLRRYVSLHLDTDVAVLVQHADSTTEEVHLTPRQNPPEGQGAIGVAIFMASGPVTRQHLPFWSAIPMGASELIETFVLFKNGIISMIIGAIPVAVAGPVGIFKIATEVAKLGISPLLEFAAFLSINLAIINILPLPALDGGRIAFVLLEWVRRGKRVSPKTEGLVHFVGFAMLMSLILVITYQDIIRIISGESLIP